MTNNNIKTEYIDSLTGFNRMITQSVKIGNVTVGNGERIKVQSMTTTDTMDTHATVEQIKRLVDVGCEIVRITTPSSKFSENLEPIKNDLIKQNYQIPIVADVHFNPNAAFKAAELVEKVRINPGNFVDRKKFEIFKYTDEEYRDEIKRIEDKFIPLLDICKKHRTVLRIGTNHGSLSDRIVNQYGDNPEGMVISAIEYLDICERENFDQIVFSMKSSNTMVMVAAYRLLVKTLRERGKLYPIHLGVTEAGDGEDGRIKSAIGIGTLLSDGIGDTIRVSLTEDPELEIPVAKKIVSYFEHLKYQGEPLKFGEVYNPYQFERVSSKARSNIGSGSVPKIIVGKGDAGKEAAAELGFNYIESTDKWESTDIATDSILLNRPNELSETLSYLGVKTLTPYQTNEDSPTTYSEENKIYPLIEFNDIKSAWENESIKKLDHYYLRVNLTHLNELVQNKSEDYIKPAIFIMTVSNQHPSMEGRELIVKIRSAGIDNPIMFEFNRLQLPESNDIESRQIHLAAMVGPLLIDGLLDGIFLDHCEGSDLSSLFSILQASRQRTSRTEYISCPSCGRTLFNLQEVTTKVKAKTNHLKGLKIAVMGCIVNGPGEMADADFGYVGSGPGKITLYKGKEVMVKNIESEHAVDRLVDLIKSEGAWQEK